MVAHPRPLIEVLAAMPDFRHHRGKRHSLTAIQAALIPFESVPPSPAHQPAGPAAAVWRPALAAQGAGGWARGQENGEEGAKWVTGWARVHESREMPGVMPLPRSPRPQGPCPDTSA